MVRGLRSTWWMHNSARLAPGPRQPSPPAYGGCLPRCGLRVVTKVEGLEAQSQPTSHQSRGVVMLFAVELRLRHH